MSYSERSLYLLSRYIDDIATNEERSALAILLQDPVNEEAARAYLQEVLRVTEPLAESSERRWEVLHAAINAEGEIGANNGFSTGDPGGVDIPGKSSGRGRVIKWRWAAVAAVVAGIGVMVFLNRGGEIKQEAVPVVKPVPVPGGNIAVLTLSDGSKVVLDSARDGALAKQGNVTITKLANGQLAYTANEKPGPVLWNTLSTPRGGQYKLVLPDGSGVWLNAASSITYPTSFSDGERVVRVKGEAYFEVAKLAGLPFRVEIERDGSGKAMDVDVLGTNFNVNAYVDEGDVRTTLIEGKVRLQRGGSETVLSPGQQGRLRQDGFAVGDADVEEVLAWKEGRFHFEDADIRTVMRQIARWYDVEVEFTGKVPTEKFAGEISRSSQLADVFKILELSNVHFKVEGKKVMVMP
jgi:ferric-dicitrate binding protein FerR (iron transport regulator)